MNISHMLKWFHAPAANEQNFPPLSVCGEKEFLHILARERARAERSSHRFSLVVFEPEKGEKGKQVQDRLVGELIGRMRATDEAGWLRQNRIGTILHNADAPSARSFANCIQTTLLADDILLPYRVYSYPPREKTAGGNTETAENVPRVGDNEGQRFKGAHYVDELQQLYARKTPVLKRSLDLFGSTFGLFLLSPLFILLWALIKIVSPGPAFYRQTRIGLGGRPFTLLKFRTMKVDADTTEHRNYLASLIQEEKVRQGCARAMAKLDDSNNNIIPLGRLIRKTYLDELPQLINVLRGDMSLIGPRPPIPYEVEEYQLWHAERLDTTPGMTGLWQVSGKNQLSFEQMVRLDIRYIRKQSFWLDIKILFKTPITITAELWGSLRKIGHFFRIGTEEVHY